MQQFFLVYVINSSLFYAKPWDKKLIVHKTTLLILLLAS